MRQCGRLWLSQTATNDNIIGSMRFALWITNAADKHTEYVIVLLIHGERASVLCL